jgi:hypothetical protein
MHEWLFNDRELEGFSTDAVRTAVTHYRVHNPNDIGYGQAKNVVDPTLGSLNEMQETLNKANTSDSHLLPEHLGVLRTAVQARGTAKKNFEALPQSRRETMALKARPFLEKVALSLIDLDPAFADLEGVAGILAARQETTPEMLIAEEFLKEMGGVTRVYMLDQGPFAIAKQALETCDGPWVSHAKRGLIGSLTGIGRTVGQVCPIAAKRSPNYYEAQMTAHHQRNS